MRGSRAMGPVLPKGGVYFEFQVDKSVRQVPGSGGVKYPDMLRPAKVEGEVLAQFVVDTSGVYEHDTFKVLKSTHEAFTQAVRDALPLMRFTPAEVGGAKVRQLVQQPFIFALPRNQ
jgi:protein TonB